MTFIDPKHKVLRYLDRVAGWDRGETPGPVTVEWDLSNRCVLGCQDCHFAHTHVKGPWATKPRLLPMAYESTGDLADINLVTRTLPYLAAKGVRSVVWSGGGEPTSHPQWVTAVRAAHAAGLEQGMYTCGTLLTPETGKELASLATWVVVSLDCVDDATYQAEKGVRAFTQACAGVQSLVGHTATVGVSFLLHAGNWQSIPAMYALGRDLGASYTTFRPAIRTSPSAPSICDDDREWIPRAMSMLQKLATKMDVEVDPARFTAYRLWDGHGYDACTGIRLNTTITPDGRVWLCPQRRGVNGSEVGDLRRESFADLWARHPGQFAVDRQCRVMCRLHPINEQLAAVAAPVPHGAFL